MVPAECEWAMIRTGVSLSKILSKLNAVYLYQYKKEQLFQQDVSGR
jgi:hypothetical protein